MRRLGALAALLAGLASAEEMDERELARTVPLVAVESASEPDAPHPAAEMERRVEPPEAHAAPFGSRFGFLGVGGGEMLMGIGSNGLSGGRFRAGGGLRMSVLPRVGEAGEWLPSVGLLAGVLAGGPAPAFFSEARIELLRTASATVNQAGFTVYGLTGFELRGVPYFYGGLGIGWNWLPQGGSSGGLGGLGNLGSAFARPEGALLLLAGVIVGLGVAAFIFAGRVEVRVLPSLEATGVQGRAGAPPAVAILLGVGG